MSAIHRLLRFGVFELNLDTEELRKEGIALKLGPQPFKVLAMLAGRAGQVVGRDEIRTALWGEETYVDFEHGLNQCIKQIRNALNDRSIRPLYIETIPRKGYRFLAPVTAKNIAVLPKVTVSTSGAVPTAGTSSMAVAAALANAASMVPSSTAVLAPVKDVSRAGSEPQTAESVASEGPPELATRSKQRKLIGWLAVAALVVVGAMFYWHSPTADALMEKDTIVLSDFSNSTGDAVFDDTLKQALRIQLEQSPFLNLVPDQRVNSTLKLTGRAGGDRLTPEVTRDICQRIGSKAMLTGSIAQLGTQYVVGVQAINCSNGDVLADALEQARTKEEVLKALDRAALSVRQKLGESLRTVQTFATPVAEVTTPSLEALKAYSVGRKTWALMGDAAALPYYQQAIELDPNFATAYLSLSSAYANLGESGRAAENVRKAFDLREKVSERERLFISAFYYFFATGELEKAAQTFELAQREYPREPSTYRNLTAIWGVLGDPEKTLTEAKEALRLEPGNGGNYANLGHAYVTLNRFNDAESVYKEAEERKLAAGWITGYRYALAFVTDNAAQMAELVSMAAGKPGIEDDMLARQSDTEAWYGKLKSARDLTQRAMVSAAHYEGPETVATYQAASAMRESESGNRQRAREEAISALKVATNRDVQAMAALALARVGHTGEAEKLAAELDQNFPQDTLVQKYWLPSIRAAVALDRKQPDQALESLKTAGPLEFAFPTNSSVVLCPAYLRGQAYLMLGQGSAAQTEFQKFIDHRGLVANFQWGVLARLGLARAYALEAETDSTARDKARVAYQEFLTLWKDADPDVPIYQQAKAEYAKL